MKKEIESLKRKTFYLYILVVSITILTFGMNISQVRQYSDIRDYYFDSLELDRNLLEQLEESNSILEEQNEYLQEVLSGMSE